MRESAVAWLLFGILGRMVQLSRPDGAAVQRSTGPDGAAVDCAELCSDRLGRSTRQDGVPVDVAKLHRGSRLGPDTSGRECRHLQLPQKLAENSLTGKFLRSSSDQVSKTASRVPTAPGERIRVSADAGLE